MTILALARPTSPESAVGLLASHGKGMPSSDLQGIGNVCLTDRKSVSDAVLVSLLRAPFASSMIGVCAPICLAYLCIFSQRVSFCHVQRSREVSRPLASSQPPGRNLCIAFVKQESVCGKSVPVVQSSDSE